MYCQSFLTTCVRGIAFAPTTAAKAGLGVKGFMKAAFGFLFVFAFLVVFFVAFLVAFFVAFFVVFLAFLFAIELPPIRVAVLLLTLQR